MSNHGKARSIYGSKDSNSDSNIHHKPVRPNHICLINSSTVSTQQI